MTLWGIEDHWLWLIAAALLAIAEMLIPGVFLIWIGVAALVTGVLALLLQGPDAAGVGLGDAFDPAVLTTTLASSTGLLLAARIVLVVVAGLVGHRLVAPVDAAPPTGERAVVTAAALALGLGDAWGGWRTRGRPA